MLQIHQYWMATICKHEGKKEHILKLESCTRTSSMFLEVMVAQASKTTELISIDGGVEYGPELPEAVGQHAITTINSTVSLLSGDDGQDASYSTMGSFWLSSSWASPINMALPPLWTR